MATKYKKLLRQVTETVKEEIELTNFKSSLMEAAKAGEYTVHIDKLEQKFPTIYRTKLLWDWARENEIDCSGSKDGNGASYIFWWN